MRHNAAHNPRSSASSDAVARAGVVIKSARDVESMRRAGALAGAALRAAVHAIRPGARTREVAEVVGDLIDAGGGAAVFRGYRMDGAPPFGAAACVCVNDEVVHGLPGARTIEDGDVVTVDVGVRFDGWCADAATTVVVGAGRSESVRLVEAGRKSLEAMIEAIEPGVRWSAISAIGERVARDAGCLTLRGWAGHGVGRALHEAPALPMRPRADRNEDVVLEKGMTLAIEPILTLAPSGVDPAAYADGSFTFGSAVREDGWTVVSLNGWLTCHFEHTIAVLDGGAVTLTAA